MAQKYAGKILSTTVGLTALGLAACVGSETVPVTKNEASGYASGSGFSVLYQGSRNDPSMLVMDKAGGLEMAASAEWKRVTGKDAEAMFSKALSGSGSFKALHYETENGEKLKEALLYVDSPEINMTYSFNANQEEGSFSVSRKEKQQGGDGGDGSDGGDGGDGGGSGDGSGGD